MQGGKLIKRYKVDPDRVGPRATVARVINGGEAGETYLNRKQAIFITAKSETPEATDITIEIIHKFDAYERGVFSADAISSATREVICGVVKAVANQTF